MTDPDRSENPDSVDETVDETPDEQPTQPIDSPTDEAAAEAPDEAPKLDLTASKVTASALAAVSSATAASYLGVAGTILGAGLGAVIVTAGTALYQHQLRKSSRRIKAIVKTDSTRTESIREENRAPEPAPPSDQPGDPSGDQPGGPSGSRRWKPLAAVACLGVVIAIGLISVVELAAGQTLAGLLPGGPSDARGTSITTVFEPSSNTKDSDDAPVKESTSADPDQQDPDSSEAPDEPNQEPSESEPADPTESPTDEPSPTPEPTGAQASPGG